MLQRQRQTRLPPGPGGPGLWRTFQYLSDPLGTLRLCFDRHGDIFTLRFAASRPLVFLCSPPLIRELFTAPPELLRGGVANQSVFGPICGAHASLIFDGDVHTRRRRLLQPTFRGERMHDYTAHMRRITEAELERWRPGEVFALHGATQRIALQIILTTVFGLDETHRDPRLERLLRRLADEAIGSRLLLMPALRWDLGRYSPWGKITRLVAETRRVLTQLIERRRAAADRGDRDDILDLLLGVVDEDGVGLTDEELCDELITMLMAGHETTGTAMVWTVERLLAHPEAAARVDEPGYLEAAIKESMRVRPIMAFAGTRRLAAAHEIGGYLLPEGANVTCCMAILHQQPSLYPEPDRFRPERFLDTRYDQYEYAPFGGGVRRCLGMGFALHEMKVVLATLLARARFERVGPPPRIAPRGFFLAPAGGLAVRATLSG